MSGVRRSRRVGRCSDKADVSSRFEIVLYHEYRNDSAGTDKASATVTISTGYQCATSRYQNAFFATETTV